VEAARLLLKRWWGFAQVPSDGAQFSTLLSGVVDGLRFFCAALVGPIANFNVVPFPESKADANGGIAITITPIPTSRRWRPMLFMT
jgi:hypothetical protein